MEFSDNGTRDYQDGNLSVGGMSLNHDISEWHIPLRPKESSWLKGELLVPVQAKRVFNLPTVLHLKW